MLHGLLFLPLNRVKTELALIIYTLVSLSFIGKPKLAGTVASLPPRDRGAEGICVSEMSGSRFQQCCLQFFIIAIDTIMYTRTKSICELP